MARIKKPLSAATMPGRHECLSMNALVNFLPDGFFLHIMLNLRSGLTVQIYHLLLGDPDEVPIRTRINCGGRSFQ